MEYVKTDNVITLRIDRGDEVLLSIAKVAEKENITSASVVGIGAADNVVIGWYNVPEQKYEWKTLDGAQEITTMLGNITHVDGKPHVHLHGTFGGRDFTTMSGHIKSATVSGACEVFIRTIDQHITRIESEETGLKLLSFE